MNNELGINIKYYRSEQNMTLAELAGFASLSKSTLSNIENGVISNPGIITVKKIADALELPLALLIR